ncbi:carbohydrate ABC transporter permease [Humibacter sp.]|jgi:multiple sugar transport system permease protein|uniref:carbohydrate ABC transporter permease n=1 Tax=Humibacter sp. TaxID=1940291 RepID=UPI002C53E89D|nr:carbohydrate ABC transporter permease [Humibacter sp.]HVX08006.1 carbohydrate ABC transporter permease [Humibacter sp.]
MTDDQRAASGSGWRRRMRPVGIAANSTVAWAFAVVFSFPLIWTFFTALKPADEVFGTHISFIGSKVLWSNFVDAWTQVDFGRLLLNSLLVAAISTVLTLVVASLTAFAFARLRFPGRNAVFLLFVITLTLPSEVAVVPLFLGFDQVRLTDTWVALILPGLFGAFGAFLLRQFMLQIPGELEEAARLDGASTWRIFTGVIIPLVRPALSVLAIFAFLGSWNSFLWPLIILNSSDKWTIPIGIAGFTTQTGTQWQLLMAACVMTIAPVVIVIAFAQRQLVAAIGAGAFGGR